ncbi:hypothetical protein F4819DRAFT_259030 [Hypoxylon fuscum]|nr:hypothetical protein F4819DRAFT_259030 [Hypoxylon fuscum]
MSWMDSWSRPGKSQATPAPYYLLPGGDSTPYCRSCGRVISSRRLNTIGADENSSQKSSYCSQRCRNNKPRRPARDIETMFVRMLSREDEPLQDGKSGRLSKKDRKKATKGDPRVIVTCDEVERIVFSDHNDPEKVFGHKKNRVSGAPLAAASGEEGAHARDAEVPEDRDGVVDLNESGEISCADGDVLARMAVRSGTRIRPPQTVSQVNGSVGGEKGRAERVEETEEMARRRLEGQRKAQQRETVRSAARRGVVFGFAVEVGGETTMRKCEAVMQGKVVEPSFAKGDWGIRWRE